MRKSSLILSVLFGLIVLSSIASALNNCQSSQTIMKLSTSSNAHVETSSGSLYSLRICYDEIFGINYTSPSPQACTGSNLVAKLSQTTNAHIEGPAGTAFSIPICYGDLICTLRSGACQINEAQIVSLAQTTNSHASTTNIFTNKLCCSSAFALANSNNTNLSSGTGLMSFIINSPAAGNSYNDSVILSITSQNATAVLYNFGTGNFSYLSPVNLSLGNGTYLLSVYVLNATTMLQQSISFNIVNSSLISNSTNTTNSSANTGFMNFTINEPVQGATYSQTIPVNITSSNATAVLYNFGTGNFTYTSPTVVSLINGSYIFTVYVQNATTLLQQSISFTIVNSTTSSNPSNNTNSTNNGGSNGGNSGGNGGSGGGSSGGVKSGTTSATQRLQEQQLLGDEPIMLGNEPVAKKSTLSVTFVQSMLILLILLVFIIVAQTLINRHSQSRNKRV